MRTLVRSSCKQCLKDIYSPACRLSTFCCLKCSALWRKSQLPPPPLDKLCRTCGQVKPNEEFRKNSTRRDNLQSKCRVCESSYKVAYHQRNKSAIVKATTARSRGYRNHWSDYVIEYLKSHPCVDCGEADPIVLDFDHVNGKKLFNVSSWDKSPGDINKSLIDSEIAKCLVRCANCHRRRTAKQFGYRRHLICGQVAEIV